MDHGIFIFGAVWTSIDEEYLRVALGINNAVEASRAVLPQRAEAVIFRPSSINGDWFIVVKVEDPKKRFSSVIRRYEPIAEFVEAKKFAEQRLVGVSIFGAAALTYALPVAW